MNFGVDLRVNNYEFKKLKRRNGKQSAEYLFRRLSMKTKCKPI